MTDLPTFAHSRVANDDNPTCRVYSDANGTTCGKPLAGDASYQSGPYGGKCVEHSEPSPSMDHLI